MYWLYRAYYTFLLYMPFGEKLNFKNEIYPMKILYLHLGTTFLTWKKNE